MYKDAKFQHIVSTYHQYENNITAYLDKLAELYILCYLCDCIDYYFNLIELLKKTYVFICYPMNAI